MSDNKTKDLFKRAAEIASVVPDAMQAEAFNRALERLEAETGVGAKLSGQRVADKRRAPGTGRNVDATTEQNQGGLLTLIAGIKSPNYPDIKPAISVRERSLRVLRLAREDFSIDGLGAGDIAKVLTDKFRVTTSSQAVTRALKDRPDLTDRSKRHGIEVYRIMEPGEQFLNAPAAEERDKPSANRASKKRNRTGRRKAVKRTTKKAGRTKSAKTTKRSGNRPGPKKMLETLISDKYFDEPRTIGDMITHIGNKKAHTYKATDLSPALSRLLRDGKLDREQDDDGQFEYQSK